MQLALAVSEIELITVTLGFRYVLYNLQAAHHDKLNSNASPVEFRLRERSFALRCADAKGGKELRYIQVTSTRHGRSPSLLDAEH
jgi:hypothetical protein